MFNYIATAVVLPPGCFLLALMLAFFLRRRMPGLAFFLTFVAVGGMYLMSTAWFGKVLITSVVNCKPYEVSAIQEKKPEMIVVLAAARYRNPPEYDGKDRVGLNTLSRLRYAVRLHHLTGLPLLVSGGCVFEKREPLAELMKTCLTEFFGVDPHTILVESKSSDTHENAQFSGDILRKHGVETILLVTGSMHMKRAVVAFHGEHLTVIPAPTHFITFGPQENGLLGWLPKNRKVNYDALHEFIGGIWYRFRFGTSE